MLVSEMKYTDRKIVRVLPTFRLRVFLEALHATLNESAVRVFERPEFVEDVNERNVVKRSHAVRGNRGVLVISGVQFERYGK
jgi:hypothetical protein